MSKIIPFESWLPNPEHVAGIICPPYDVISSLEARKLAEGNDYSFLHITRPEIDLSEDVNPYSDEVYRKGRENFLIFQKEGFLKKAPPAIYIYRLISRGHAQTGVVCGVSVAEYESGAIKRHEKTREEKVLDRTRHADIVMAHTEPVLLMHRENRDISTLISEETMKAPLYDVTDRDGVKHKLWRSGRAETFQELFQHVSGLYIADGHHRSEAALRVRNLKDSKNGRRDFFPAAVFSEDELRVFEYNWKGTPEERPLSRYSVRDIMACADKKEIMPPKSTWFAPKLTSGLFVYDLCGT